MPNRSLVVLGLLLASPAFADPPRYTRKQNLAIDVKPSDRTRPIQPTTTTVQGPSITGNDVMRLDERNEPLRREQEAILVDLVTNTPDSEPDKADLLFRLAEHYAKQQRFWRLKSLEPTTPARPQPARR